MLQGNISKSLVKFALPCILMRIIQNIYPLIDSIVVGKVLDTNSLSAVGIATSLYSLFNETFLGLVSGFSIVASKKIGARDHKSVSAVFLNSAAVSLIVSAAFSIVGILFSENMLLLLNTPNALMNTAREYLTVLLLGLILNVLFSWISEMLRAVGNSKMPLILLLVSTVLHLLLLYPLTREFGVIGTALATLISYLISDILGILLIKRSVPQFNILSVKNEVKLNGQTVKECLKIGVPMALTNLVVMVGVLILSFVTNNIGVAYISAYTVASKIGYILTTPIFGFATAVSVFVSQNFGARSYKRIESGVNFSLRLVGVINACIFLLVIFFSKAFLGFMLNNDKTAVQAAYLYLCIRCASTVVLTPAAIYKNILPAIGKPLFSTVSGFLEIGMRFLFPLAF